MTTILRKMFLQYATILAAAFIAGAQPALAQYPTKPITMIISVPPGAGTDVAGRMLAERLGEGLGQKIVVENRPGASSLIAANLVAKAASDGYMLLFAPNTILISPHLLPKGAAGGVDVIHDLVPVINVGSSPLMIAVHPSLGVKTIQEYVALARRTPDITYATSGVGSPFHIAGELLQRATGVKLTHVSYKGIAEATMDVVSGQVQTLFGVPAGVVKHLISAGKIVPLAVAQKQRSPLLPNVPTLDESKIPGVEVDIGFIVFAPAATPPGILARLNQESVAALRSPKVRDRLAALGIDAAGGTQEETRQQVRDDYQRYGRMITEFDIKE